MEKVHPNLKDLPRKRKRVNSDSSQEEMNATQESAKTTQCITDQDLEQQWMELFSSSGVFSLQRYDYDKLLWGPCEEIIFHRDEDNRDSNP